MKKFALFKYLLNYLFIGLFVYWIICLLPPAFAQKSTDNTIAVTPSIIRLDLATDQPEADLIYTNNTTSTVELALSASDFTELEDSYKLSFLEGKNAQNYQYSLSSWIKFDSTDVTISPHESKTVRVFVDKDRLTTGAHYGTILAKWIQREHEGNVKVNAILSSLLFVRTAHGNEREEGSINFLSPIQNFFLFPDEFALKFKNNGNVDLTPHGLIEIKNMFHITIARGILNENSIIVLPESIRRFTIPVTADTTSIFPGIYDVTGYVHFGVKDTMLPFHQSFFSIGSIYFLLLSLIFIIIIGSIIRFRKKILHKIWRRK